MRSSLFGTLSLSVGFLSAVAAGGCAPETPRAEVSPPRPLVAAAAIEARSGSKVTGAATFTEADGKVRVVVTVAGATPGPHAVHVHEKGDCSDPEAKSAGSHFNPDGEGHRHGAPSAAMHHAGDFGNLEVGDDGTGRIELETSSITVRAGPRSVVGRAIIVHEKADDFVTQPTGNAGGRIGCGLIRAE